MKRASLTAACLAGACLSLTACVTPLDPVLSLSPDAIFVLENNKLPAKKEGDTLSPDAVPIFLVMKSGKTVGSAEVNRAVIVGMINRSDSMCEAYMVDVLEAANTTSAGLGASGVIFGAASTATTGSTATALAGVGTAATGVKTGLSNDVMGGKSADVLYRGVMARRLAERLVIIGLLEQPTQGFEKAMGHLSYYHTLCGPAVGLGEISAALDRTEDEASELAEKKIEAISKAADPTR